MTIMIKDKKNLILTIIAVSTLVFLIIGATYAFFNLATNNFRTTKVKSSIENMGTVALTTGSDLKMTLTLDQMSDKGTDVAYYASKNGATTVETSEAIGKAVVTGDGTFSCNYTISFDDSENSLYDIFQETEIIDISTLDLADKNNQIIFTVNDTSYDFATADLFPQTISGTLNDITESSPQFINAQLKVINKTGLMQTGFAGAGIKISFTVDSFECVATN